MIRVLIADDEELLREGFRLILEADPEIEVVGEAADGEQAVRAARRLRPDVVLMDIRMPGTDGVAATRQILGPGSSAPTRVVVLTTFDDDASVRAAVRAGACGYLLKTATGRRLTEAVHAAHRGETILAPELTRRLLDRFGAGDPQRLAELTGREREVLVLLARGLSNEQIAGRLFVSVATVKTHVNRIFSKLGVRDRAQAVAAAYEAGLVRPGDAS